MDWLLSSPWFQFAGMPLLIVLARVIDVSVGTIRIIFVARGHKVVAAVLGFFEVTIWLLAISQVMKSIQTLPLDVALPRYLAYGVGFAMGTWLGIHIEEKVAAGLVAVRVITQRTTTRLPEALREEGYGVTTLDGQGRSGPVVVMFVAVRRKHLRRVIELIDQYNPKAFYSVESIRSGGGGTYLPGYSRRTMWPMFRWPGRKGK